MWGKHPSINMSLLWGVSAGARRPSVAWRNSPRPCPDGGDLDGDESEEQLKGILESMMSQLLSKEVLYEPLKELHDKVCRLPSLKIRFRAQAE